MIYANEKLSRNGSTKRTLADGPNSQLHTRAPLRGMDY